MATIKDIAKDAGVSVTTVSRYLNNDIKIRKETADKIDTAIAKMNYTRNFNAAAMKSTKSKIVILVFPNPHDVIFADMVDIMYKMLTKQGYFISTIYTYDDLENEIKAVNIIRSMRSDGCIFVTEPFGNKNADHLKQLSGESTNIVLVNRFSDVPGAKSMNWRLIEGVNLAIKHLLKRNVKKIGIVLGWGEQNKSIMIIDCIKKLYNEENVQFDDNLVNYCFFDKTYLDDIVDKYLESGVDAIFALTDSIAADILEVLKKRKVIIPDEISLISCGNSIYCKLAEITSVDLGTSYMGTKSTELLLSLMKGIELPQIEIPDPVLLQRKSTKTIQTE